MGSERPPPINLAACLGILERRTLIVDADPQANATSGTGLDPRETQSSIYESIVNGAPAKDVIQTTDNPNLDILPGSIDLVGARSRSSTWRSASTA